MLLTVTGECFVSTWWAMLCHQNSLNARDRPPDGWLVDPGKVLTGDIVITVVKFSRHQKQSIGFWQKPAIWVDGLPFD
ncbi:MULTISPECIES: hypothetical protein [unclassified Microcoleus]|jgi:hypothetical protein|uniref:hypothetical protein n=1 Tax=unclassified Microcoleus TaxID=2642155 RepID=UPI0025D6F522|nr:MULTISPECIES: hypothetical protein [unclassified Microcoleus]